MLLMYYRSNKCSFFQKHKNKSYQPKFLNGIVIVYKIDLSQSNWHFYIDANKNKAVSTRSTEGSIMGAQVTNYNIMNKLYFRSSQPRFCSF